MARTREGTDTKEDGAISIWYTKNRMKRPRAVYYRVSVYLNQAVFSHRAEHQQTLVVRRDREGYVLGENRRDQGETDEENL